MKNTTRRLRKLKKQEVERLRDHFVESSKCEDMVKHQVFYAALQVMTRVDLPLGEVANPEMSEIIKVWSMFRTFIHGDITDPHQLRAQGLEGLVSVEDIPLGMALLAAIKTGIYRIEIFVPRGWTCDLLRGVSDLEEDRPTDQGVTEA